MKPPTIYVAVLCLATWSRLTAWGQMEEPFNLATIDWGTLRDRVPFNIEWDARYAKSGSDLDITLYVLPQGIEDNGMPRSVMPIAQHLSDASSYTWVPNLADIMKKVGLVDPPIFDTPRSFVVFFECWTDQRQIVYTGDSPYFTIANESASSASPMSTTGVLPIGATETSFSDAGSDLTEASSWQLGVAVGGSFGLVILLSLIGWYGCYFHPRRKNAAAEEAIETETNTGHDPGLNAKAELGGEGKEPSAEVPGSIPMHTR